MRFVVLPVLLIFVFSCAQQEKPTSISLNNYFTYSDGVESAGIRLIPIQTPIGEFKVWTKRFGNNPKIKILLLHGGPAMTHEYMECFETFFQRQAFEFYEYDQLGSDYSDQTTDRILWTTKRFFKEGEKVHQTLLHR